MLLHGLKKVVCNEISLFKDYAIGMDAYAIFFDESTIGGVDKHVAWRCITKGIGIGADVELLSCRVDVDADGVAR